MLKLAKTFDLSRCDNPKLTAVFIHGIAASSKSFDGLFGYIVENDVLDSTRIVAFDLLGSGKSLSSDKLEYNYDEQIEGLYNAIKDLNSDGPLILVGHSMGTMIVTRFASLYPELVDSLVLISAPVYHKDDIENPLFKKAMNGFRNAIGAKKNTVSDSKAFNNEIKNIVSDTKNYDYLLRLDKPTVIIYGELDRIIASFNLPQLLKANTNIKAIKTAGAHGVSKEKYTKIVSTLNKLSKKEVK